MEINPSCTTIPSLSFFNLDKLLETFMEKTRLTTVVLWIGLLVYFCGLRSLRIGLASQPYTQEPDLPAANTSTLGTPKFLTPAFPAADLVIYSEAMAEGWGDWSWEIQDNLSNHTPVHNGTNSIAIHLTTAWDGFQLGRNDPIDISSYDILRFWIHGGQSGSQRVTVQIGGLEQLISPTAGQWTRVDISLSAMGNPREVATIIWWNGTNGSQPYFYLDDIAFVNSGIPPTPPPVSAGPALSVDAAADQHLISDDVYGMNFASEDLAAELHLPVNRWGGNSTTRYNWQNDTSNHASDWYFENIPNDNDHPEQLPDGSSSDKFVEQNQRTGTQTLLTIPLIGWTPKSRQVNCGFSVAKYGAQDSVDPWQPDCGNGMLPDGQTPITGNDPHDTSSQITTTFIQDWVSHLTGKYGSAANGGVRFYDLDNEPMLWNSTHRDAHPLPTSYDEIRDRTIQYAAALKASDPGAQILGPVVWGWTAYFWSALDWAPGGNWWDHPQDRLNHGDIPFIEWYLQQMASYQQAHGARILDYLDIHYYPQADNVTLSPAGNTQTQALRLRSTRSLWDSTYTDESWIDQPVNLIPRMRAWVNSNYPGTRLAITEYNWGGLEHINGALAQADVLGIFGREGLDLATLWDPPDKSQPGAFSFRIFLNYDGAGGRFGNTSLGAISTDQSLLSIYAAMRSSDHSLTIIIINKNPTNALTSTLSLANFNPAANAAVYRYSKTNLSAIVHEPDQSVGQNGFTATFPPYSITLMVIPPASPPIEQYHLYQPLIYSK